MIVGIGIDVVSVERMRRAARRSGERFLKLAFTPAELDSCRGGPRECERLAARFAAKEAVVKALGTGFAEGASLRDIEVINDDSGKPEVALSGATLRLARRRHVRRIHLSISHTEELAAAQVVMEGGPGPRRRKG